MRHPLLLRHVKIGERRKGEGMERASEIPSPLHSSPAPGASESVPMDAAAPFSWSYFAGNGRKMRKIPIKGFQ